MAFNAACLRTLSPPLRAEARLGEEMFINGYALKTWEWLLTHVLDLLGRAAHAGSLH